MQALLVFWRENETAWWIGVETMVMIVAGELKFRITKDKRKTLSEISALLNHMKPSIQRSELPTTNTYRNICTDGPL